MSGVGRKSKAHIEELDKIVIDMMLKGKTPISIMDELINKYDVKTMSSAKHFIRRCNKRLTENNEQSIDEKIAYYKSMYLDLYNKSVVANERRNAKEALDSLVKLEGLLTHKLEVKSESKVDIDLTNITDDKLSEIVDKFINKNDNDK